MGDRVFIIKDSSTSDPRLHLGREASEAGSLKKF
jgi:hypothetical protein